MTKNRTLSTSIRRFSTLILFSLSGYAAGFDHQSSNELSEFEEMLVGFPSCQFDGVYLDLKTKAPVHKYFVNRNLKPNEINGEFAIFILGEKFYGINVHKMLIPASTFDVHALYLKESVSNVKNKLSKYFRHGFYSRDEEDHGEKPTLRVHPDKSNWSVLSCSPRAN